MSAKRIVSIVLLLIVVATMMPVSPAAAEALPAHTQNTAAAAVCPAKSLIGVLLRFNAKAYDLRIRLVYQDVTGNWRTIYDRPGGMQFYSGPSPFRTSPNFYDNGCGWYKLRYDLKDTLGRQYSGYLGNAFYVDGTHNYWFEFQL